MSVPEMVYLFQTMRLDDKQSSSSPRPHLDRHRHRHRSVALHHVRPPHHQPLYFGLFEQHYSIVVDSGDRSRRCRHHGYYLLLPVPVLCHQLCSQRHSWSFARKVYRLFRVNYAGHRSETVNELHAEHGPLVRIQPGHISIASEDAIKTIYGHSGIMAKTSYPTTRRSSLGASR